MSDLLEVTDENFDAEIVNSDVPAMVDFWAPWCGPCKMVAPILNELAEEHQGRLKIGKVNVEESPRTASQYGIMSIPTLIFFKGGEVYHTIVGAQPKNHIEEELKKLLTD